MKKLLSLLLVLAMTLSLAVPMVSASEFTDVDNTHQYFEAIQSLVARGIVNGMGDGTFAPEANVTRAQFAKMVVLSIGITNAGDSVDSSDFPDVAKDHWAAGYIKTAFGQGIINGFEDGTFRPEENVTYEQAITMVIRAKSPFLKVEADKIGYPDGYLQIANKYKFLKGITDGVNQQPAKRGTIAKLMDNMLKIELKSDNLGGIPQIEVDQSEEVRGQVMAVKGTSLIAGDSDGLNTYQFKLLEADGDIVIYDAKNLSSKDSLRSYLGKQVIVYYEEESGARVQLVSSMNEQRNRNYEVTVNLDDIDEYSNSLVEYEVNGEEAKIYADDDAIIMYNGSLTTSELDDLLDLNRDKAGSIRFLCSEGEDSPSDVIFITSYTNWYVTSTTSSTKTVYGEIAGVKNSIVIDDEASNKTVSITKNGKNVPFSDIKQGQILSISKSDDGKVIDVIISDKTVSGAVTGKNDGLNTIIVQSKTYGFTDGLTAADINLGVTLKLYIDAFGKVAKYTHQMVSNNYVYGYLIKASNDGTSMDGKVAMKILKLNTTSVSSPAELYLADSVTINNRTYKPSDHADNIIALLKETAQYYEGSDAYNFTTDEVCQPIRYTTGTNNTITSLYIGTQDVVATESDLKVDKSFVNSGVTCSLAGSSPQFNPHFKLNSSTHVIFVPTTDEDRENNLKYKIVTAGNAKFVQGDSYKMITVDTTSLVPKAVIVYKDPSGVASTEWESCLPMLVTNKQGIAGTYPYEITLQGYTGEAVPYYDESGAFYSAVNIGDVVRVSAASDKKVEEYEIAAKATEIYAGREYIKPITNSVSNRVVNMYGSIDEGTMLGDTYSHFAEGDRSVTRKITLYAGVAYDIQEDRVTMRLVKKYPDADTPWTLSDEVIANNTKLINTSGAKVVAVDMGNTTIESDDVEVIDVDQILTYTHDGVQENADKLVVYCFGENANLIVVYKNAND